MTVGPGSTVVSVAPTGAPACGLTLNYLVAASLQASGDFIVQNVQLDGGNGPIVVASAGSTVSGVADWQVWSRAAAPGDVIQLEYGIDGTCVNCLFNGTPGAYPGQAGTGTTFTVIAPTTPGLYGVYAAETAQFSCCATNPFSADAGGYQIAQIVVP